jgi:hypothetical protein
MGGAILTGFFSGGSQPHISQSKTNYNSNTENADIFFSFFFIWLFFIKICLGSPICFWFALEFELKIRLLGAKSVL